MTRVLLTGGLLAALMGVGVIFPVAIARLVTGEFTWLSLGAGAAGCGLIVCGVVALLVGSMRPRGPAMPGGVRAALAANMLILAFCALELSDRLVRQDGQWIYWTTFLLPLALLLFYGLLSARRWAWWTTRILAALATLWFLAFVAVIPFADLHGETGPTPWYGRVYMAAVTLVFAAIMAAAYWSLGRPEARRYFGLVRQQGIAGGATDNGR
jgi:hypothetical protein